MLILLGPSASGKTESAKIMINRYSISRVVTCTTRPKRVNEIDGFDYYFMSEATFAEKVKEGYFAETTQYNHYHYGTPIKELKDDKLIILEPKGLKSILDLGVPDIVAIYLKTQESCRTERMLSRGDSVADVEKRILSDRVDFNYENIEGLDLIIDTTNITLSDLADMIFYNYQILLANKKIAQSHVRKHG